MPKADTTDSTSGAPAVPMEIRDGLEDLTDATYALTLAIDGLEYMHRDGVEPGPRLLDGLQWLVGRIRADAGALAAAAKPAQAVHGECPPGATACPCATPCQWATQALDALKRGDWPRP